MKTSNKKDSAKFRWWTAGSLLVIFALLGTFTVQFLSAGPSDSNDPNYPIADLTGDYRVNVFDLSVLLSGWNTLGSEGDFNNDGIRNIFDLSYMLAQWLREDTRPLRFSTFARNIGPLANEFNVASNGDWVWGSQVQTAGTERYALTMRAPYASTNDNYFWSSSFRFSNRSSGGYIGMQTDVFPLNRARGAIFSIWDTTVAESVGGGVAQPFGGEGIGMQTARPFNWGWNVEYDVIIERDAARSDGQFNWWRGYIVTKSSQSGVEIGRIRTPVSWGRPVPRNTFLERYGAPNTCGQFEQAGGAFNDVRARVNGVDYSPTAVSVELREYSDCGGVVSASGTEDGYSVDILPGTNR